MWTCRGELTRGLNKIEVDIGKEGFENVNKTQRLGIVSYVGIRVCIGIRTVMEVAIVNSNTSTPATFRNCLVTFQIMTRRFGAQLIH
jgi:hypothetical protein